MDTPKPEVEKIPPEGTGKEPKPEEGKGGEPIPETVTLPKKEVEQMKMQNNLTANLQDEVERLKRPKPGKKVAAPDPEFPGEQPEAQPPSTPSDDAQAQHEEFVRFKEMVNSAIAQNPDYLKLLGEDTILRRVIASNPLSLLTPQDAAGTYDAEDALDKVTEALDERVSKIEPEDKKPVPEGPKPPEGMNADNVPTPPAPAPPKKAGMAGVEEGIMSGIKQ